RDFEEPREVAGSESTKTLGDISRRRRRRVLELIAVFEILRRWPVLNKRQHLALQLVRQLPAHEFPKVAHAHASTTGTPRASSAAPYVIAPSTLRDPIKHLI